MRGQANNNNNKKQNKHSLNLMKDSIGKGQVQRHLGAH